MRLRAAAALCLTLIAAACGDTESNTPNAPGASGTAGADGGSPPDGGDGGDGGDGTLSSGGVAGTSSSGGVAGTSADGGAGGEPGDAGAGGSPEPEGLVVEPEPRQELVVAIRASTPTLTYSATFDGAPAAASWSLDRDALGTLTSAPGPMGTFTPSGVVGGLVNVTVTFGGEIAMREIFVKLHGEQNGADVSIPEQAAEVASDPGSLRAGGGPGGVGGEGLGVTVTDAPTLTALATPSGNGTAQNLKLLYPYDGTVFPRGVHAPLLAWDWSIGDADAILIELATESGSFDFKGTFGRPSILSQTGGSFIRHPIPQDIWVMATNSAGGSGDKLTVRLTVSSGGQAYGPVSESWIIAPAVLPGIIYYSGVNTALVANNPGAVGGDNYFGNAVLGMKPGDTAPMVIMGQNGTTQQCYGCHSVDIRGSRMVAMRESENGQSFFRELADPQQTLSQMIAGAGFPALYPDGSMVLEPNGALYALSTGDLLASGDLSYLTTNLGTPAFSATGQRIVVSPMDSPSLANPTQKLVALDFNPQTLTFSNPVVVADHSAQAATFRPGWPAFLPDNHALVYHRQSDPGLVGNAERALQSQQGAKAQIYWTNLDGSANVTPLNRLNGLDGAGASYLPSLPSPAALTCAAEGRPVGAIDADHGDDANLNYQPGASPLPAAGYAWVIFTSRRMYGNVATIPPFCSDPRGVDLDQNITTKKLWIAAVDLDAAPGTDGSHPAFYLPAQELLAANTRATWALESCRADGAACQSGAQCCNGFCSENGDALECSSSPGPDGCSDTLEKCVASDDCCDLADECFNGFCAQAAPN